MNRVVKELYLWYIPAVVLALLSTIVVYSYMSKHNLNTIYFDKKYTRYVQSFESLEPFFYLSSWVGSTPGILLATIPVIRHLFNKRQVNMAWACIIISAQSFIIPFISKHFFNRERPYNNQPFGEHSVTYAFPSGHSVVAPCLFFILIWLLQKEYSIGLLTVPFFIFQLIGVCASRVYYQTHFPTDMIGGLVASFVNLAVFGCGLYLRRDLFRGEGLVKKQ
ncbi:hypothetical protein AKO1_015804 [Acrasis kona]|uniref:Phosphatidic acid phosphatase type 2/haloperoxidase domain-containing protein n=1 Tax=Acrasis kona TaxID=1008807 RepID=A0AAW2ZGV6_9EUKA